MKPLVYNRGLPYLIFRVSNLSAIAEDALILYSAPARLHRLDSNGDNVLPSILEPQLARRDGSNATCRSCRRDAADHNAGELTKAHTRAGTRRAQEHGLVCAANLAAFFALDHCLYIKEKFTTEGSATQSSTNCMA